jgi:hypothetical protein
MKQQSLTPQQISKQAWDRAFNYIAALNRPNPPSTEAIKHAQFVDKTYHWNNADLRSGDKRASK